MADHGNAETMIDPITKGPHTYHTTNPVPFIVMTEEPIKLRPTGALKDVAPTLLGMLGLEKPKQMIGEDLRERQHAREIANDGCHRSLFVEARHEHRDPHRRHCH